MATNRTPISRTQKVNITPDIVSLYRAALAAEENAALSLHVALGRKPWQADVLDTVGADEAPQWERDADRRQDWMNAREILRKLDAAMA